jgi:hypothetical protein
MTQGSQPEWFCSSPDGNKGPFTIAQIVGFVQQGLLQGDSLVWKQGMPNWLRLADCSELRPAGAGAPPVAGPAQSASLPRSNAQDDHLDAVFVEQVRESWRRHHRHQLATEVDEVLVGAVITATLDSGYVLIDLESTGISHFLRFEMLGTGARIIFKLDHGAESVLAAKVLGHESRVTIGYGERVQDFSTVLKAIKQELKGGFLTQPDPGIITVDGDMSSQYIYVEVGLIWDLNDYLDPDDPYKVNYPKLTEAIGASINALSKYLHGRLRG